MIWRQKIIIWKNLANLNETKDAVESKAGGEEEGAEDEVDLERPVAPLIVQQAAAARLFLQNFFP